MELTEDDLKIAPELRDLNVSKTIASILNNFYLRFPSVKMKRWDGETHKGGASYNRKMTKDLGWLDLPHNHKGGWETEGNGFVYSVKKGQQTPRQFYRELDRAVREAGFTSKQMSVAVTEWYCLKHTPETIEKFGPIILAVYIKLRKKGYTYRDLTG
ncbi:MAG: hypothetical protein JWO73_820 [Candidatus Taylorbacteria bacterium]|nr:hypothetical protein [Candidatus Taylorbacteria bacterium]